MNHAYARSAPLMVAMNARREHQSRSSLGGRRVVTQARPSGSIWDRMREKPGERMLEAACSLPLSSRYPAADAEILAPHRSPHVAARSFPLVSVEHSLRAPPLN
jgi:hypothetical protein